MSFSDGKANVAPVLRKAPVTEGLAAHVAGLYDWNPMGAPWSLSWFETLDSAVAAVRAGKPSEVLPRHYQRGPHGKFTTAAELVAEFELEAFTTV